MSAKIERRGFLKTAMLGTGFGAGLLTGSKHAAAQERYSLPAGLTREDLVHLIEGPWRRLQAVFEKKVIDLHTHNWEVDDSGLTMEERRAEIERGRPVDYTALHVRDMDVHGIDKATTQRTGPPISHLVTYEQYLESIRPFGGRIMEVVDSRTVEPQDDMKARADFTKKRLELGGRYMTSSGVEPERAKEAGPLMEVAEEFDVPVYFGLGFPGLGSPAHTLAPILRNFPRVKCVGGDSGGARGYMTPGGWMAIQALGSFENLYITLDKTPIQFVEEAVKAVGPHRLLYASDLNYPFMRQYRIATTDRDLYQRWRSLNAIALAEIPEYQKDYILYKNARQLLKLDKKPYTSVA